MSREIRCHQEREVRIYTYHMITLRFQTVDSIGRLHLTCKDCHKSICMKGDINDYRENQIIKELYGGEE